MGTELVVAQQAASALAGVSKAAGNLLAEIQRGSIVRQSDRQLLKDRLALLRHQNIADCIAELGSQQLSLLFDLYDQADRYANTPAKYQAALMVVQQTSDQLAENVRRFMREIR
jgi:hypothetical protein